MTWEGMWQSWLIHEIAKVLAKSMAFSRLQPLISAEVVTSADLGLRSRPWHDHLHDRQKLVSTRWLAELLVARSVGGDGEGLLFHRHVTLELRSPWTLISIALLLRPCEVLSGISNPTVLEVANNPLGCFLQYGHMLVGSFA